MQYSDAPRSRGVLLRRFTGESTPYTFKKTPIRLVKEWKYPFEDTFTSTDFSRADEHKDPEFYVVPRFVYHIDEASVSALTNYYKSSIKPNSAILDICSSWVSHYPLDFPTTMSTIKACGLNKFELMANDQLTGGFEVVDLNPRDSISNLDSPIKLPYPDDSFDVVTCVVSIDYLNRPVEVLNEVKRVLKVGGKVIVSQSDRFFPSKVVNMWLNMNDRSRLELINGYFHFAGGFEPRDCWDISPSGADARDPMFIVEAKLASK